MSALNERQSKILEIIKQEESISSSGVFRQISRNKKISLITIKRDLDILVNNRYLERIGKGRSVVYVKTIKGSLLTPVDIEKFNLSEPDIREGRNSFNFSLFNDFPKDIFSLEEIKSLNQATSRYRKKIEGVDNIIQIKELERFVIELSWKSSKIEGNTYTLLDTEKLIKEGIPAEGHPEKEAVMILNHKKAFYFILENINYIREKGTNISFIEKVHELIIKDLEISQGLRNKPVGIIGTKYKPLDNKYQIREALEALILLIKKMDDPYSKALILLAGFSYIQPFEDGNKRTARLLGNAILLSENCAPLSYRSVDEKIFREATLVFYEINSILSLKNIFINQYLFSTDNYLINLS